MPSLYVHLPFCPYICPYCDFAKWPHKRSAADKYLRALISEINRAQPSAAEWNTVYLGGGTPNTYDASQIGALLDLLRKRFPGPKNRETTIELNPELVGGQDFIAYRKAGINRVSIGVQSFVESEVRTLGRKHTIQDVRAAVASARAAGIRGVSVDLMFAVPGQTPQSWSESVDAAISLGVDHVSAYGLTVETGTPYERWREREPQAFADDAIEAELYSIVIDKLESAGFEQYEISNFARPGHASEHNANYWANGEYAGFGTGAASYLGGVRSVNTRDLRAYVNAASSAAPIPADSERLEGMQKAGEAVMLALRTAQGVPLRIFKERYGFDFIEQYGPVVERYSELGLLEVGTAYARLTRRGRFLANEVCAAFVTFA